MTGVAAGAEPWILGSSDQLALIRRLERDFPLIEEVGCKIGIGVATGADQAFIGPYDELDVEPDRKLPLAMTRDIITGTVKWRGLGVVNPFTDEGRLVDLARFPRLKIYLEARKDQIAKRHIAKKAPANWYRTIDRIHPDLARKPKLLIPDIKGQAHIVYECGKLYPHHNLYFITSNEWDLYALQTVLLSGIARLFVSIYSTRMRGGYLRFQAQYLRRIRLPYWQDVDEKLKNALRESANSRDIDACNAAVFLNEIQVKSPAHEAQFSLDSVKVPSYPSRQGVLRTPRSAERVEPTLAFSPAVKEPSFGLSSRMTGILKEGFVWLPSYLPIPISII